MIGTTVEHGIGLQNTAVVFFDANTRVLLARSDCIEVHRVDMLAVDKRIDVGCAVLYMQVNEEKDKREIVGMLESGHHFSYNLLTDKFKSSQVVSARLRLASALVEDQIAVLDDKSHMHVIDWPTKKVQASFKVKEQSETVEGIDLMTAKLVGVRLQTQYQIRDFAKEGEIEKTIKIEAGLSSSGFDVVSSRLVLGDCIGRLHTLTDVFKPKYRATINHWHSQAVGAISFLPGGNTILSGGKEAVVVLWKDENTRKDFCPRLDGEIIKIVCDELGEFICVVFHNHKLRIVRTANFQSVFSLSSLYTKNLSTTKIVDFSSKQYINLDGKKILLSQDSNVQVVSKERGEVRVSTHNLTGRNTVNHFSKSDRVCVKDVVSFLSRSRLVLLQNISVCMK